MAGKMPAAAHESYPDCMLCKDTGLQHLPNFPPSYRFCMCRAGFERQQREPYLVEQSNARERELGIGIKK